MVNSARVNFSVVGDPPTKCPRHRNLILQYNCAANSGLCVYSVFIGSFPKRKSMRLCAARLLSMERWNGDMQLKRSLASGCWDQEQWELKWLGIGISVIKETAMDGIYV